MRFLKGKEEKEALEFILKAAELAKKATCERSKCGANIVSNGVIIGEGYNSPPGGYEEQRRCSNSKSDYHPKVTDKTCCIHAEQRAIIDALINNSDKLFGSRLYFIRLDEDDVPSKAGNPYCTICSKMVVDVGIQEFVLWHEKGICVYDSQEYNDLSYAYES